MLTDLPGIPVLSRRRSDNKAANGDKEILEEFETKRESTHQIMGATDHTRLLAKRWQPGDFARDCQEASERLDVG
jgi:hypothetical protein